MLKRISYNDVTWKIYRINDFARWVTRIVNIASAASDSRRSFLLLLIINQRRLKLHYTEIDSDWS